MKRLVGALLLCASTALGQWDEVANGWSEIQNAPVPLTSPSTGTLDIRPGSLIANNLTATALATPTVTSVTPTLTKIGSITTVAGASLVDGDYFTVDYGSGTIPIEFEATPPNGTTGGRIPFTFAAGDAAGTIRDGLIALINLAAPTKVVASIGGAAAITVSMVTPGEAGGVITENVANAGFTVAGFANPTAATTYGYKVVSYLADGTSTAASTEVTTAAGHATLSASNFNTVVFAPSAGSTSTRLYRTTGGTAPPKLLYTGTATSYVDTGAAGTAQAPATTNTTGIVTAGALVYSGGANAGEVLTADANGRFTPQAGGGGITNSAGANVIPKSDGTNLIASSITEPTAGIVKVNGDSVAFGPAGVNTLFVAMPSYPAIKLVNGVDTMTLSADNQYMSRIWANGSLMLVSQTGVGIYGPDLGVATSSNTSGGNGVSIDRRSIMWARHAAQLSPASPTTMGPITISVWPQANDDPVPPIHITGAPPDPAGVANIVGGGVHITGGPGSSGSAGAAHGGDVIVAGGAGYGTGSQGLVRLPGLRVYADNAAALAGGLTAGAVYCTSTGVLMVTY